MGTAYSSRNFVGFNKSTIEPVDTERARALAALAAHAPPARACQYTLWPHGAAPTHQYCGKPVKPGSPYCHLHHARTHISLAAAGAIDKRRAGKTVNAKPPR